MYKYMDKLTIKRLAGEHKDLEKNRMSFCQAKQDDKNKLVFHVLLRGDDDSDYAGGYYLGKIVLPPEYPRKAGDFYMLTPNGRFLTNRKICLTNSSYHPESHSAGWSVRSMLVGLYSIFIVDTDTGISHIKETPTVRKANAKASIDYNWTHYPDIFKKFDQFVKEDGTMRTDAKEVTQYIKDLEEKRRKKKEKKKEKKEKKEKKKKEKKAKKV
jgi:ubiquitin-conjugating enzyme E2 J2